MILSYLVVHSRGGEFILYDHHYDPKHSHHLRILINALHFKLCIFRTQNIPRHSRWSFSVFQKVFSADLAGDWAWGGQCVMEAVTSWHQIRSCVQRILVGENIFQSFGRVCLPGFCRQVDWLLFQPLETSLRNT